MEKPRDDTTHRDLLDRGAFTCVGIAADPQTQGQEKPFKAANQAFKISVRAQEDKSEEVLGQKAIFVVKDTALDRDIIEFEARLLVLVNKKRDAPLYRRYFKDGLRDVTQAEPRIIEPALAQEMIQALAEDEGKPGIGPLALEMGPRIQSSLDSVKLAEKDLSAVEAEADYMRDKTIPGLRATWVQEYVKLHSAVVAIFHDQPDRAESFFRPFRKERKKPVPPPPSRGAPPGSAPPPDDDPTEDAPLPPDPSL